MQILSISELSIAVKYLKQHEPVAFPTETVYGLGAPIFSEVAIQKVFVAKNRPPDNPLIAHIAHLSDIEKIAVNIPSEFYKLAEAFWPGPLSILLEAHPEVPLTATAGLPTIAVRMPDHSMALALIDAVGQPLVAPSANISGRPSSTTAQHVIDDFEGRIHAVLDGGVCSGGLESTVLSLHHPKGPAVLRPGSITCDQLSLVLGRPVTIVHEKQALCPGMKYRHYAPKAHVKLLFSQGEVEEHYKEHPRSMLLQRSDNTLSPQQYYASLRSADDQAIDNIFIFCDEAICKDEAFFNRILKSAGELNSIQSVSHNGQA